MQLYEFRITYAQNAKKSLHFVFLSTFTFFFKMKSFHLQMGFYFYRVTCIVSRLPTNPEVTQPCNSEIANSDLLNNHQYCHAPFDFTGSDLTTKTRNSLQIVSLFKINAVTFCTDKPSHYNQYFG